MKITELRIGNLVYWDIPEKIGVPHKVLLIKTNSINTTPISLGDTINDYLPITLTEEWLLRFGFRKKSDHIYLSPNNDSLRLWGFAWNIEQFMIVGGWIEINTPSIKYVHQLQNLYFALTGIELQLSST